MEGIILLPAVRSCIIGYDGILDGRMATLETLLLCNHAEARDGLLYVMGGGWTDVYRGPPTKEGLRPANHFGIAVSILVSWNETNRPHRVSIRIESDDGKELLRTDGQIEVGRPAGLTPGSDQRAVFALNADLRFPVAGGYRVVGQVGDDPPKSVSFRVHDKPHPGR